ncbi:hypothetical protein NDU88_002181 [Pleurodeles waltl]|uniref:Uncharacterized protein n=1 Tax=Pleurodeles waltl TaxID=8319 RepID=A0AAV7M3B7_PLEWA|nr:hypothetical protein NDU88_002181 [Pleurodeles waltl]
MQRQPINDNSARGCDGLERPGLGKALVCDGEWLDMRPHENIAWRDCGNIVDLLDAVYQMPDVLCLTDKNIGLAFVVLGEMWLCGSRRGKEKAPSCVKL